MKKLFLPLFFLVNLPVTLFAEPVTKLEQLHSAVSSDGHIGLALVVAGIVLVVLELFVVSFGLLAALGIAAFVIGAVFMFDGHMFSFAVTLFIVIAVAVVLLILLILIVRLGFRSQKKPVVTGSEQLEHAVAEVMEVNKNSIQVRLHSELWQAVSTDELKVGDKVKVIKREGLVVTVKKIK
jgi:membrane-bound serine protease (ClpP class)